VLIRIWIERTQPLAGTAATRASEPLRFDGWLELLRVVSELVAATPSSGENADTAAEPPRGARLDPAEPGSPKDRGTEEGGTMRIGLTSIFVDDQDKAERFYTQVLGFRVKTSAPYGPDERWLSVVAPEEPDGVELVLHLADEPARAFQAASRQGGRPMVSLRTDDCAEEAARLKAMGVVFVKEPARMAYGGMDAVLDDTCGNLINLHQD
jgi:catechol 2,3-dioxygenase-like lactoylglutathione lyase family enzyme